MEKTAFYRTIWRWHFYAGLFVIPFIVLLSITGAIYLFKPQIDRWEEREWRGLSTTHMVSADRQLEAALAALPGSTFNNYRLPEKPGDAAVVHVALPHSKAMRDVVVSPEGRVLAVIDPESRITPTIARIHGSLLMGLPGGLVVELAASWAIVLILSGLYLWWPRGHGLAGVLSPRLKNGKRLFWRDLHAVTGFWVAGLALITLASGLPWTDAWATGFRFVRAELGWIGGPQNWKGGSDLHGGHDHAAMMTHHTSPPPRPPVRLSQIVAKAETENMPFPAIIQPPFAPARFGPPNGNVWTLTSETQNRTLIRTVHFDPDSGAQVRRSGFNDKHVIDRVINYGIAWHEGQLLGLFNQIVGVLTALALVVLATSGAVMWWRRRPAGGFGAPSSPAQGRVPGLIAILLGLAALLPMLALSLIVLAILDWVVTGVRRFAASPSG